MQPYYKIKATLPTKIKGGVRKLEVEIMPDFMSYIDAVYNKNDINDGMVLITNEQGYEKGYDETTAKELLLEVYSNAISFEYIMFFEKTKSGAVRQIESCRFQLVNYSGYKKMR